MSKTYRPVLTIKQVRNATIIHGAFESIPNMVPVGIFFVDPPGVPEDCSIEDYEEWFSGILCVIERHRTRNCGMFLTTRERKGHPFLKGIVSTYLAQKHGWQIFRNYIWLRQEADFNRSRYPFLNIYAFRKGDKPAREESSLRYKDIIRVQDIFSSHEGKVAPMPLDLIQQLLPLFASRDDVVMDPFAGSGIVARACMKLNLRSISVELHRERFEKIVSELEEESARNKITLT